MSTPFIVFNTYQDFALYTISVVIVSGLIGMYIATKIAQATRPIRNQ